MKILVVDDEKLIRSVFERSFTKWGHSVVSAQSVQDALESMKSMQFDVFVVDLELSDSSGLNVIGGRVFCHIRCVFEKGVRCERHQDAGKTVLTKSITGDRALITTLDELFDRSFPCVCACLM
jgi:hypothetical protein